MTAQRHARIYAWFGASHGYRYFQFRDGSAALSLGKAALHIRGRTVLCTKRGRRSVTEIDSTGGWYLCCVGLGLFFVQYGNGGRERDFFERAVLLARCS